MGAMFMAEPVTRTGFAKDIDDVEWERDFQLEFGQTTES